MDERQPTWMPSGLRSAAGHPRHVHAHDVMALLRRHPLAVFFVLAFAVTWAIWVPRAAGAQVGIIRQLSTWAVAVAAVLTAVLTGGRAALVDLGARLVRWRVSWRWYLLVLLGPALFSLTTAAAFVLVGGTWSDTVPGSLAGNLALLPLFILVAALTDGLGEELGWRGFALPRLLSRHAAWVASLLLGLVWATWHLPLLWTPGHVLYGQPFWLLLLDLGAKSIIFTWVFLRTRGSVLIVVLLHATNNVFGVSPAVSATGGLTLPLIALSLEWVLAALVLIGGRCRGRNQGQATYHQVTKRPQRTMDMAALRTSHSPKTSRHRVSRPSPMNSGKAASR
jgi:membrane protease YdiL (CAAX protease family)